MFPARLDHGGGDVFRGDAGALIRRISAENPLWGAPRIHGELLKLGFEVAQWSVATLARHAWAFSFCSFCSYRPERAASHANGASFNRPDPPLGHGDPALDTRTDAKSARMPSTIPIKKFDGLPSDLVRPPQSEARHRAPDNR